MTSHRDPALQHPVGPSAISVAAVFGGVLVMASSIAAAAARWGTTPLSIRLLMLGLLLVGITTASELVARRIPVVGRVLIHLAALLVLPMAITATAQLGGSWRTCLVAGGLGATAAVALQGRRRQAPLLVGAAALGMVIASAGAAALTSVPVAGLIAGMALLAAVAGLPRRSTFLALTAAGVPSLVVLSDLGVGPGTVREMGAVGHDASVGALIAGLVGAAGLAWVARTSHSRRHAWGSAALVVSAAVAAADVFAWFRLPRIDAMIAWAIALIAGQIVVRFGVTHLRADGMPTYLRNALAITVECLELVLAFTMLPTLAIDRDAPLAAALLAVGCALGTIGRRSVTPAAVPAALSAAFCAVSAGQLLGWSAALAAAAACCIAFSFTLRRPAFGHTGAVLGALALLVEVTSSDLDPVAAGLLLAVTGIAAIGAAAALHHSGLLRTFGATCMVLALVPLADGHWNLDLAAVTLVLCLAAAEVLARRVTVVHGPRFLPALVVGAAYLISSTADASPLRLTVTLGMALVTLGVGVVVEHRPAMWSGVAVAATVVLVAIADELRSMPTWVWAMAGGLALLVLAGVLENRRSRTAV